MRTGTTPLAGMDRMACTPAPLLAVNLDQRRAIGRERLRESARQIVQRIRANSAAAEALGQQQEVPRADLGAHARSPDAVHRVAHLAVAVVLPDHEGERGAELG